MTDAQFMQKLEDLGFKRFSFGSTTLYKPDKTWQLRTTTGVIINTYYTIESDVSGKVNNNSYFEFEAMNVSSEYEPYCHRMRLSDFDDNNKAYASLMWLIER